MLSDFELYGKSYGHYVMAKCPFHDDHKPSLMINENGFRCLSCGEHGSHRKLLAKYGGNIPEVETGVISPWRGWIAEGDIARFCYQSHRLLLKFLAQAIYLRKRKIAHLVGELRLGWSDGWYIFPMIDDNDRIFGAISRAGETVSGNERYLMPKGIISPLYVPSWQRIHEMRTIYLTFGVFDAITLYDLGLASISAIGKSPDPALLSAIRKKIIIIPDRGEERDAKILASKLGWRGGFFSPNYPEGTKDLNDVLKKYDLDKVKECINAIMV
jgi:DNA primase